MFFIDEPTEEVPGAGIGRIVAYDRDGNILHDYANHSLLNNPWGMVIAPDNFGTFSNALLVTNFGGGTIAGYDVNNDAELGCSEPRIQAWNCSRVWTREPVRSTSPSLNAIPISAQSGCWSMRSPRSAQHRRAWLHRADTTIKGIFQS